MTIGIYALQCRETGKQYIGQSNDIEGRIHTHFTHLKRGQHHNTKLQEAFWEYGMAGFEAYTIQECEIDELNEREEYYIKYYRNTDGGVFNSKRAVTRSRNKVKRVVQKPISKPAWAISLHKPWLEAGEPTWLEVYSSLPNVIKKQCNENGINAQWFEVLVSKKGLVFESEKFPYIYQIWQWEYTPEGLKSTKLVQTSFTLEFGSALGLDYTEVMKFWYQTTVETFEKFKI